MKINVAIFGGSKEVQIEAFNRLKSAIYFDMKLQNSHTITETFIITNTVYKVVAVVLSMARYVDIYICAYNSRQELPMEEIETDILRSVNI